MRQKRKTELEEVEKTGMGLYWEDEVEEEGVGEGPRKEVRGSRRDAGGARYAR